MALPPSLRAQLIPSSSPAHPQLIPKTSPRHPQDHSQVGARGSLFSFAFVLVCHYTKIESKSPNSKASAGGSVFWIEFSTSRSLAAASTAAASRATQRGGETPFSFVK